MVGRVDKGAQAIGPPDIVFFNYDFEPQNQGCGSREAPALPPAPLDCHYATIYPQLFLSINNKLINNRRGNQVYIQGSHLDMNI